MFTKLRFDVQVRWIMDDPIAKNGPLFSFPVPDGWSAPVKNQRNKFWKNRIWLSYLFIDEIRELVVSHFEYSLTRCISTSADISLNVLLIITKLKENVKKPQSSSWLRKPFKKKIINVESQCDLYNPIKILENDRK